MTNVPQFARPAESWTPDEREVLAWRRLWAAAATDPLIFLGYFAWTADQHDKIKPIKSFPIERPYLQDLVRLWIDNPRLVVLKGRQLLLTWLFTSLALWDAMFHSGRLIMLQSKREEDAIGDETSGDGLLGRAKFIMNHLPLRALLCPEYTPLGGRILFPKRGSTLWAIPQGGAIIRQRTASGILSDEAAFQEDFGEAYTAAQPCVRGGGWFVALSTADLSDGGAFRRLYEDRLDEG